MNVPPAVAKVILDIVATGLRRLRAAGWSGDPAWCAAEADHLHNLPGLLANFSQERLEYYWEVERPAYAAQASEATGFEAFWQQLRPLVEPSSQPASPQR